MLSAGVQSVKLENGLHPQVQSRRKYYKAQGTTEEQVTQWFKDNGMGSIVKEVVHFGTMQGALNEYEELRGEIPSDIFQVSDQTTVRMGGKSKFLARTKDARSS